jgi:hypothetical protein
MASQPSFVETSGSYNISLAASPVRAINVSETPLLCVSPTALGRNFLEPAATLLNAVHLTCYSLSAPGIQEDSTSDALPLASTFNVRVMTV